MSDIIYITKDELNKRIARALGWSMSSIPDEDAGGETYREEVWYTPDDEECSLPDWSSNVDAALKLCLEMGKQQGGLEHEWSVNIGIHHGSAYYAEFLWHTAMHTETLVIIDGRWLCAEFCDTPALALAHVALVTLEAHKKGAAHE